MDLSIIIPVYNTELYLERCFYSVLSNCSQRIKIEVIFVNDGSTDNSLNIIKGYEQKFSFVTVLSQENSGLSIARNNGIKNCTGNYFILLDSDDWINIEVIEKLFPIVEINNIDLLSFRLAFINENNVQTGSSLKHPVEYNKSISGKEALIKGYHPSSSCLFLYRADFIRTNNLTFYPGITQQDVEFTIRMLLKAKKVYFSDEVGYCYYRRSDSVSMSKSELSLKRYFSDAIVVAYQIKNNIDIDPKLDSLVKGAIIKNYNSVIWNLLYRFVMNPKEVDHSFKKQCLESLKIKKLYPIKGRLKTPFQNLVRRIFNIEMVLNLFLKR